MKSDAKVMVSKVVSRGIKKRGKVEKERMDAHHVTGKEVHY